MDDRIIPEEYICPITKDVMEDPVVASDGHTYERIAIMQYLENEGKSPITRQEMNESQLLPNRVLKTVIDKWRTENQTIEVVQEEANNESQEAMNEDIYFDVETKLFKYKNTNELVSSEFVFVDNCFFKSRHRFKYKGSLKEGKEHGKGICYYENGKKHYEGDYFEGRPHGNGISYYYNGNKAFEGEYSDGKRHGKGIQFDEKTGKKRHEGDYADGKPDGIGVEYFNYRDGIIYKYEGEYSQGKRHGKGVDYYYDKRGYTEYEGNYYQDKYHGKGIYYFKNGKKQYEGQWSQNKRHGKGVEYYGSNGKKNKKKYEGLWSQDKFKSGTFFNNEGIEFLSKDLVKVQKLVSLLNMNRRSSKITRKTKKLRKSEQKFK